MEEKAESDRSYSGESSSSSTSSSGSTEGEDEAMETVRILGHTLDLPQELCEDYGVFREFFSMKTWEELEDDHKENLKQFLPKFPENDEEEKEKTIKMLFNCEPFHFTSPLDEFYNNLRQGNFRPDIAKMRKFLKKARAKQQKHRIKSYYAKLLPEVLISRERLLAAAKACPPGPIPHIPLLPPKPTAKSKYKPLYLRVKYRYFEELAAIRSEVGGEESEDESYPEGPPEVRSKKKKQLTAGLSTDGNVSGTLGGIDASQPNSLECLKNVLASHRARRQYRENHPELNTTGISLDDIKQRVALVNGAKKLMFGGQKSDQPLQKLKRGPKKEHGKQMKSDGKGIRKKEAESESVENRPLLPNIKIKCEQEESDSESSSFVDPVASPRQSKKLLEPMDIKQELDLKYPSMSNINFNDPKLEHMIKQEPIDPSVSMHGSKIQIQHVPIKLEDLDGIDMMDLPVQIADDSGEVVVNSSTELDESVVDPDESLTETTHANFLSLVRALFPARAAHRASKQQLHARCSAVMRSPIAPLNTWYNMSDDWCAELDSALDFLAGERGPHPDDFVPYLQYMPETQVYQWIGAGRDCDAILGRLCERWLRAASPPPCSDPPPPKYPTSWVMRAPTSAEIAEFRAQERKRYSCAGKPFTYVQYGYRSVVGPVGRACAAGGGAGAGALLAAERPRGVSLGALVRDAAARLPNGEGTRHDVLTLLKMSQWIAPCTEQALMNAVSSTLDRLHSAKRDPPVKYDHRTAIWTYLHRNRSEEDWLKSNSSRGRSAKPAAIPALPAPAPHSPPAMEMEVASVEEVVDNGSDTDVDVDDSSSPSSLPHLSSAQLLMQATQSHKTSAVPLGKPKGKLVAVTPPKAKPAAKQTSQAKQPVTAQKQVSATQKQTTPTQKQAATVPKQAATVQNQAPIIQKPVPTVQKTVTTVQKQANLLAQAAKQASLVAQAAKQTSQAQAIKQATPASKPTVTNPQQPKQQTPTTQAPKLSTPSPKQAHLITQAAKQAALMAQSAKQASVIAQLTKQAATKSNIIQPKQVNIVKQPTQSPKQNPVAKQNLTNVTQPTSQTLQAQVVKPSVPQVPKQDVKISQLQKALPTIPVVPPPNKSPLIKQRLLQKQVETPVASSVSAPSLLTQQVTPVASVIQPAGVIPAQTQPKVAQGPRSLLIKPPAAQTTTTVATTLATQPSAGQRRGIVRVLSPATPSAGKSLISPRALMPQTPAAKKRVATVDTTTVTTVAQNIASATTVVSSAPTAVTSSIATRTVQLAGGRTVQLANQTVHLPGGQAVQLSSGHTLQLSSLQLPTHSVRLPSGQTVQLASPQTLRAVSTVKATSPRAQPPSPTVAKPASSTVQIPISSVQLAGQTVQIAGQTVQIAGQSVQLTGHTVKLPSGQSVQVASPSVLPSQSVQLPSGQTVQLASGNMQTVQLGQNVQVPSMQTVQLAGGQTVQLPSGQTLQLASGQTVQLSSGQTLQLASGQTVQLASQQGKPVAQVVRNQAVTEKTTQPIVAKLLTNAQGQMVSGVRVVPPGARVTRPLLLTAAKPLHNIILQQSDGSAIRVTSSGGASTSQTIVLGNIGAQTATTPTTSAPVLKLQQVNPIQQVKLAQGIKLQQAMSAATVPSSAVRSVLMDGQQLKLVGGRHVLARILRPAHPPPQ